MTNFQGGMNSFALCIKTSNMASIDAVSEEGSRLDKPENRPKLAELCEVVLMRAAEAFLNPVPRQIVQRIFFLDCDRVQPAYHGDVIPSFGADSRPPAS